VEKSQNDAQAHRSFRGRVGNNKDREHLPIVPHIREKTIRLMFTAFNISSMDISMMITLRRVSTPITPIVKSARLRNR
jgi:hypothetical protein